MYYVNFTFFTKIFIKIIEFAFTLVHTLFIMFCELITKLFEIKLFFFSFTFGFNNIIFMNFFSVNFWIQWRMIKIIFPIVFLQHFVKAFLKDPIWGLFKRGIVRALFKRRPLNNTSFWSPFGATCVYLNTIVQNASGRPKKWTT